MQYQHSYLGVKLLIFLFYFNQANLVNIAVNVTIEIFEASEKIIPYRGRIMILETIKQERTHKSSSSTIH
jgi:hypothetical protein